MNYNIDTFIDLMDKTTSREECKDLVVRIILEAESNEELLMEALDYVNAKLNWSQAIENCLNMSELN